MGWVGMGWDGMGWDGMVIIGHRSSKSTFDANNLRHVGNVPANYFFLDP